MDSGKVPTTKGFICITYSNYHLSITVANALRDPFHQWRLPWFFWLLDVMRVDLEKSHCTRI
jgi:hypothetical protein